jgi:hypothetical protein
VPDVFACACGAKVVVGRIGDAFFLFGAEVIARAGYAEFPDDGLGPAPEFKPVSMWGHPLHICGRQERGQ